MDDDQFTKLFKYMQAEFAKIHFDMDHRFTEVHTRIDHIYTMLDEAAEHHKTNEQERLFMQGQIAQHDKWIIQAAKKVGVSYKQ